jgi:hypothetical protein
MSWPVPELVIGDLVKLTVGGFNEVHTLIELSTGSWLQFGRVYVVLPNEYLNQFAFDLVIGDMLTLQYCGVYDIRRFEKVK